MSTMLGKSFVCLEISQKCLDKVSLDDSYMDIACFHAYLSLELLIKFVMESCGVQSSKNTTMDDLLTYLDTVGFQYSRAEELRDLALSINSWRNPSEYGSGIKTTINKVQIVYDHINRMNKEFDEFSNKDVAKQLDAATSDIDL